MAMFGGGAQGDSQLHDELKYLATSIESINQRLAGATGGVSQKWLEGTDRKLYTVFQLVQETEKKLVSDLETQSSLLRRSQQDQMGKLTTQVAASLDGIGVKLAQSMGTLSDEFSRIRAEMVSMRTENAKMRAEVSELIGVLRDQVALMREVMKERDRP
jgi:hypothetical protein